MKSIAALVVSVGAMAVLTTVATTAGTAFESGVRALPKDAPSLVEAPEFQLEMSAIVDATAAFFEEVEAASSPPVPQIRIENGTAKEISYLADSNEARALSSTHGPMRRLTGYGITVYPVDRTLGTVDFMGTWGEDESLVCGFLTWDVSDPYTPTLDTVVADFIDADDLQRMPDDAQYIRLLEANCAHGAATDNYAVLDLSR